MSVSPVVSPLSSYSSTQERGYSFEDVNTKHTTKVQKLRSGLHLRSDLQSASEQDASHCHKDACADSLAGDLLNNSNPEDKERATAQETEKLVCYLQYLNSTKKREVRTHV